MSDFRYFAQKSALYTEGAEKSPIRSMPKKIRKIFLKKKYKRTKRGIKRKTPKLKPEMYRSSFLKTAKRRRAS